MELFKHLDLEGKLSLLFLLNEWWTSKQGPTDITQARVASIFKKGNPEDQANYRPISLLNTFYKIMAAVIKERTAQAIDTQLQQTQYGFRAHRSTIQAIHAIRRTMDKAEREGAQLGVILLDWEKAFDKISHTSLLQTLARYNMPPQTTKPSETNIHQPTILRFPTKSTIRIPYTTCRNQARVPSFTLPVRDGNVSTLARHPYRTTHHQGTRVTLRRRHTTIRQGTQQTHPNTQASRNRVTQIRPST